MAIDKIVLEFQAETTKLRKELEDLKGRLGNVETNAKKAGDKIDDVGKGANGLKTTLKDLGKTIAAAFAVQQLVSFGREAVKAASAFEKSMGNVATLVDTNVESMDAMGASVRDLAKKTPVELGQLSSALYDVRSAGVSAEDAMAVLESSAQLGVAGLSTTAEAANIMTSAVNAFAAEGLSAEQISDILFKTVKAGKTTLSELTNQFGSVSGAAASAGVSLADLQASTAAITTLGTPAATAQTQIKQALTEMQKPGKELSKIFQQLGAKDGIELIKTSGGLGNAFKLIKEQAEASGMTVAQVTGSVETASAVIALGDTVNQAYTDTLADMTTGTNAVNTAFEKQAQTADAQFQLMQNAFEDVKIEIGNALMPVLLDAAEGLRDFMSGIDEDTIRNLGKALAIAAAGFAGFKFGQLVQGLAATIKGMKGATLSVQGLSKAVAANPFGLIASAVAALIAYAPDLIDMFSDVTDLQKDIAEASSKATENLRKEQSELNLVADALSKTNPGSEERAKLLKRFNELSPVAIKDLKDETKFNGQLKSALDSANQSFEQRIRLRAAEAVAQTASQKQIEAEAKAIELRDKLLKSGLGINATLLDEYAKRAKAGQVSTNLWGDSTKDFNKVAKDLGINIQSTGWRFSEINKLIAEFGETQIQSAEAGQLLANVEKTMAQSSTENVVQRTKDEERLMGLQAKRAYLGIELTKEEEAELKRLTTSTKENTDANDDNTDSKEKTKTALEKLNEELANLKTAQENATFEGDIDKAKQYQDAISKLENQLAIFKKTLEDIRGGVVTDDDLKKIDEASDLSWEFADNIAKGFGLGTSERPKWETDEEGPKTEDILTNQEKAQEKIRETQEKIRETQDLFNNIANSVTSVTGPAFAAINALYDANLQRLENEKNQRLANENLTAEERLRIEEEYEQKKNEMMAEQFEVNRISQIINATMSAAQAALNAYASTAIIPAIGPGLAPAAAAIAAGFGALQIGVIAAQPNPYKFYDGTPYLQLGDNPKGRDTIPVMAHEGEAIIPTRNNLQYPGLAKSWIDGDLDRYINNNFVRPALMEQQKQAEEEFADRLAASMALQMAANFDDYRLHRDLKEQTAVLRDGFQTMKTTRKKLRGA
jgi:TP901 family phage tail tape measure protein